MEGQFYFMGIAGLAVSLAGFAWLVSAFRQRSEAWSEVELWRLRTIARSSILCALIALLPVPLFTLTKDLILVARLVSGCIVLFHVGGVLRTARRDPRAWPSVTDVRLNHAAQTAFALFQLANVLVWGSLGILELGLVLLLTFPAGIFLRVTEAFKPGPS